MKSRSSANPTAKKPQGSIDSSTREHLLDVTGELITERGSADISLNDIAERSGMNSALIKYYFGNKSGLLIALFRKPLEQIKKEMDFLLSLAISPERKMRIHIHGMIDTYSRFPYYGRLMNHMLAEDPETFGPLISEEFTKLVVEAERAILEEGIKAGHFKSVDPMLFYIHVSGACNNLYFGRWQLDYLFGIKTIDDRLRRQFNDHLCDCILHGILSPPSP
jgi:AcrR family transcriptional regulator